METIARTMILLGLALVVIGAVIYGLAKINFPLGRLPGDIRITGENGSFYFPLTSSILVSIVLTVLLNLITRFFKR